MKARAFHARRWISLGLLFLMALSVAVPAFALPNRWYKKIYVHKNPTRMTYEVGDDMDLSGLVLWGDVYDGDGTFVFTNEGMNLEDPTYFKYSPTKFTKVGKQKVTFSCWCVGQSGDREWLSTSINVTVEEAYEEPASLWYSDIFVSSKPKKTAYVVGESLKTSGLVLGGHYYTVETGSKKLTDKKLDLKHLKVSPSKFTEIGTQEVKLSLRLPGKNGEKWFSTTLEVEVEKAEIKITKHPLGETVKEGGACNFTSRADYDESQHWFFIKGDEVVDAANATATFPGLSLSGISKEKLKLSHIPASLNGWSVYCVFYADDGSATSDKADIVVLSQDPTLPPVTPDPLPSTPKAIDTTPQSSLAPVTVAPGADESPAVESGYAEGIHCTINGESQVPIEGETLLTCVAEDIDGFVFDHWEVNGQADYSVGSVASFLASGPCVIRARYHERKVLRTVNSYFQFLTKNNNASGTKYTEFDFENVYLDPILRTYCPAGTLTCYVTAVIPKNAKIDYWLINGVKYQFPESNVTKFRLLELDEATTIEPVFTNASPLPANARPETEELVAKVTPRTMRCINCWGQFMNASGRPSGEEYREFEFEDGYMNQVTQQALPGGKLDIFLSTRAPKGTTVDMWLINNVKYQFPQVVTKIRVLDLDEDTTYEVRFRGVSSTTSAPAPTVTPYNGPIN